MTSVAIGRPPSRSTASTILAIHAGVLLLLTAAGLDYCNGGLRVDSPFYPACIIISSLVLWWYWSWLAFSRGGWFDPYILFLTAAVLFNCGQPILEVCGLNEQSLLRDHFSEEISLETLYLVALGISAFHFGVLLTTAPASSRCLGATDKGTLPEFHFRNTYRVGVLLLLISAVPSILDLRDRLQIVMTSGYESLFQQQFAIGSAAWVRILSEFLVPGAAFVIAGGMRNPIMRGLSLSSITAWSALVLFAGGRAHGLMPALGMVWLWDRVVHPISKTALIGAALLMLCVVFPIMAVTRHEAGVNRLSLGGMQNAYAKIDNPAVSELSEMGFSANTIAWTMELVPSVRPFALGGTYLGAILAVIPNVSSGLHPAMRLFGYEIPEEWITWEVDPAFASQGGGYGYSFIAEAYLNFGWAAPIALFALGAIYGRLRGWALIGNDPARMAIMAIFLSSVLFFARASLIGVMRPFTWQAFVPYFVVMLWDSWSSWRQVPPTGPESAHACHKAAGCGR
jgi:oligosaccharide repeat unit polymerase